MSRETEADRIARERRLQNEEKVKKRRDEAAQHAEDRRRSEIREITKAIPPVLQLLINLNYPDMKDLTIWVEAPFPTRLFKREIQRIKAGWYIGEFEAPFYDIVRTVKIYLISDGSLLISADPPAGRTTLPHELGGPEWDKQRSCLLHGLSKLRQELEAKLKK